MEHIRCVLGSYQGLKEQVGWVHISYSLKYLLIWLSFALSPCRPLFLRLLCLFCWVFFGHAAGTSARLTFPLPVIYIREEAHGGFSMPANGGAMMMWVCLVKCELGEVGGWCWVGADGCWWGCRAVRVSNNGGMDQPVKGHFHRRIEYLFLTHPEPAHLLFFQKTKVKLSVDSYFMLMLEKFITNNNTKYQNIRTWWTQGAVLISHLSHAHNILLPVFLVYLF